MTILTLNAANMMVGITNILFGTNHNITWQPWSSAELKLYLGLLSISKYAL
jgi:hypothetical protein